MKKYRNWIQGVAIAAIVTATLAGMALEWEPAFALGREMSQFGVQMLAILPAAFVIIGLFEVWQGRPAAEIDCALDKLAGNGGAVSRWRSAVLSRCSNEIAVYNVYN